MHETHKILSSFLWKISQIPDLHYITHFHSLALYVHRINPPPLGEVERGSFNPCYSNCYSILRTNPLTHFISPFPYNKHNPLQRKRLKAECKVVCSHYKKGFSQSKNECKVIYSNIGKDNSHSLRKCNGVSAYFLS